MNESISNQFALNSEEIAAITQASQMKKNFFWILYGLKSLAKNPFKALTAISYIITLIVLWLHRNDIISHIYPKEAGLLATIYKYLFAIGIPLLGTIFFLLLIALFGIVPKWTKKANLAFISAGIYTRAKKAPFLLAQYRDKVTPVILIFKIHLNGNTDDDFIAKRKNLNSELGIAIKEFKPLGTEMLLMYAVKNSAKSRKQDRRDLSF